MKEIVQHPTRALAQSNGLALLVLNVFSLLPPPLLSLFSFLFTNIFLFFVAICIDSCNNEGICTAPDTCTCTPQWSGPTCFDRISSPPFSFFLPLLSLSLSLSLFFSFFCFLFVCVLLLFFSYLKIAVCTPECENGDCTAPDTCTCTSGWTGPTCKICKYLFSLPSFSSSSPHSSPSRSLSLSLSLACTRVLRSAIFFPFLPFFFSFLFSFLFIFFFFLYFLIFSFLSFLFHLFP